MGRHHRNGEKLRTGEKSVFSLGRIPVPALAVGNTDSFTRQPVPLDKICGAKPTVFLQHGSAKWCEQTQNCTLFFQDSIAVFYKSSFFQRYEARVEAEEVCLSVSHLEHK